MSGIICSQGGHLISGQMAKEFSSAWTSPFVPSWRASQKQCNPRKPHFQCISVKEDCKLNWGCTVHKGFNLDCMESSGKKNFSEASAVHEGEFRNFFNIGVAKVHTLEQSATVMRSNSCKMLS